MANDICGQALVTLVATATGRLTVAALVKQASRESGCPPRQVRAALRALVESGDLAFYPEGSGSFVDLGLERCVPVGRRLAICPAGIPCDPDYVAVRLHRGAAFGCGRHPSTRLALRGIEAAFNQAPRFDDRPMLDIGTGSGVLAIAALHLGASTALAVDIDPVAIAEARANVALNGFTERAVVDATPIEHMEKPFGLTTANLRYPTLCRLAPHIGRLTVSDGRVVLAGFRPEEAREVLAAYGAQAMRLFWQEREKGWTALGLVKK